jgi:CRP-like cAMP-binding protein
LAALPPAILAKIKPKLTHVALTLRQPLYAPEAAIDHVFFPELGMISLVANLADGLQAEVGIIGQEGMLGVSLLAGVDTPFSESMVQMAGAAYRMTANDFRIEIDANPAFRAILLRYNEALQAQVMQTAACNANHGLEQRLARWLLMAHDRADGDELRLTQEFLAMMLGVHRPSVTVTAGILQRAGLIRYAAGTVTVLDRASLEASACECHSAVRKRFAALFAAPF